MSSDMYLLAQNLRPRTKLRVLAGIGLIAALALACVPPIPQNQQYHLFADSLCRFGIVNGANVFSNIFFTFAGLAGLLRIGRSAGFAGKFMWVSFYCAVTLVGFGSAYYHWQPSNDTLVWDRLPMTLAFSSLTAALIAERISIKAGKLLFTPLMLISALSVVYWWATEKAGAGDLRPYILVQYLPMVLLPAVIILYRKGPSWDGPYWALCGGYAVAKVLEWQDASIFFWTGQLVSGHTLKHIVAASAILLFQLSFRDNRLEPDHTGDSGKE